MSENNERQGSNRRVWIIVLIVVLALSCACVSIVALGYGIFRWAETDIAKGDWSPNLGRVKESSSRTETYEVGISAEIEVSNQVGEVRITGTQDQAVTIVAKLEAYGDSDEKARDILREIRVDMQQLDNGRIVIDARIPHLTGASQSPHVDLEITAPATCNVRVRNDVGSVRIEGVSGAFDIQKSVGEIRMDDVRLTGDSTIETSVGEIRIELPRESAFYLRAKTGVGDIRCDFDIVSEGGKGWGPTAKLEGTVGRDPEIRLEVTTGTGAITIKEY